MLVLAGMAASCERSRVSRDADDHPTGCEAATTSTAKPPERAAENGQTQAPGTAAADDRFARPDVAELTIELATERSPGSARTCRAPDARNRVRAGHGAGTGVSSARDDLGTATRDGEQPRFDMAKRAPGWQVSAGRRHSARPATLETRNGPVGRGNAGDDARRFPRTAAARPTARGRSAASRPRPPWTPAGLTSRPPSSASSSSTAIATNG
jgi:hypothetical protein